MNIRDATWSNLFLKEIFHGSVLEYIKCFGIKEKIIYKERLKINQSCLL